MTTYVALLRAVNVAKANRCSMADLKASFVSAGFADAVTHIQTGNVIFTSKDSAATVKSAAERAVERDLGFTTTAIIRTATQMQAVAAAHPFSGPGDVHVFFLDSTPTKEAVAALDAMEFADAECVVRGDNVYRASTRAVWADRS